MVNSIYYYFELGYTNCRVSNTRMEIKIREIKKPWHSRQLFDKFLSSSYLIFHHTISYFRTKSIGIVVQTFSHFIKTSLVNRYNIPSLVLCLFVYPPTLHYVYCSLLMRIYIILSVVCQQNKCLLTYLHIKVLIMMYKKLDRMMMNHLLYKYFCSTLFDYEYNWIRWMDL